MKIAEKKPRKKNLLAIALIILFLLLCAYAGLALRAELWPFATNQSSKTVDRSGNTNPTNLIKTQTSPSETDSNQTSNNVPLSSTTTASITQLKEDNNNILFTATINGNSSPGTCVVTFSNSNDKPYVQQTDSTKKGDQTVCGPLVISSQNFSYLGQWSVTLRFYENNEQATANGTIDIQ